jgi:hypothetical protein
MNRRDAEHVTAVFWFKYFLDKSSKQFLTCLFVVSYKSLKSTDFLESHDRRGRVFSAELVRFDVVPSQIRPLAALYQVYKKLARVANVREEDRR